jgi:hypothetical protein
MQLQSVCLPQLLTSMAWLQLVNKRARNHVFDLNSLNSSAHMSFGMIN